MKQNKKTSLICFFDSGIGGLNLLKECVKLYPQAKFVYFADNYNVPYGLLPQKILIAKTDRFFKYINYLKPDAAVIACNTVTAQCAEFLRDKYSFPIVGIQPAIKPAAANGECLVLSTPATARSAVIKDLVVKYGNGRTTVFPCTGLAEMIESNINNLSTISDEIEKQLPDIQCSGVVLGCTHYIFVKDLIAKHYNCAVYDGLSGTAARLLSVLGKNDHLTVNSANKSSFLAVSDINVRFLGGNENKNKTVFYQLIKA